MPTPLTPPPRPELIALLDAVKDNPDEDTPRLVLADWLDEQDDPLYAERAKFIRKDIARYRAAGHGTSRGYSPYTGAGRLWSRWLGPIAEVADGGFNRGLPVIQIRGTKLLTPGFAALMAGETFAFVQFVDLTSVGELRAAQLADLPELRYVSGIHLSPIPGLRASTSAKLLGSSHLAGMRHLDLYYSRVDDAAARALASNAALGRLRSLSLPQSGLSDAGAAALAGSPHLTRLEHLDLGMNRIGDAGAEALASSPALASVRGLYLRNNRFSEYGKQLLRDKFGDRVRV